MLKGGSFIDMRDGDEGNNLKIRVSARIGKHMNYTALNVGFRCAQSLEAEEVAKLSASRFKVVRLRIPVIHGKKKKTKEEEPVTEKPKLMSRVNGEL